MFNRIAGRYDLMNRLMTGGLDGRWRRMTVAAMRLQPGDRALDLGCGTGDLARDMLSAGAAEVVGVDIAAAMLAVGQRKLPALDAVLADGRQLPFADECFAAAGTAFTARNIPDLGLALHEVWRVLRPGGRLVILDLTRPPASFTARLFRLHTDVMVPRLGALVGGDAAAYRYLPQSVQRFLSAGELRESLLAAGFARAAVRRLAPGEVTVAVGIKG